MRLEEIAEEHEDAFAEMLRDYAEKDPANHAELFAKRFKTWTQRAFQDFVKECRRERQDWRPKAGQLSVTSYLLLDGRGRAVGYGRMRFPLLNADVENQGGNLLFDVPPSVRRQGYGALTLNRLLFEAVRAGLARVLVSCPCANMAARRCIELNRGELEAESKNVARYWIRFR